MKKTLKTLVAVICGVLTLSLTACQKDAAELILGTWIETEATYTQTQNDETISFSMLDPGETVEMTFKNDGTYTTVYHSVIGDSDNNGTWSINEDNITMTDEMGTSVYHIDQLDKKTCVLSYSESDEDEDGPYTATIVTKLTRK